jgi:hypothetical protein
MAGPKKWTPAVLEEHLVGAVELELTTIPPYLTALWSLGKEKNQVPAEIVKSVVMEEMLHLALASNVLNAIGGHPSITAEHAPRYPAALPFHEPETFEVGLRPFSKGTLKVFMAIENPSSPRVNPPPASATANVTRVLRLAQKYGYKTIGEFYGAIESGLEILDEGGKGKLFSGDVSRQITEEYLRGSDMVVVTDLKTALTALKVIVEQGEGDVADGSPKDKYDEDCELAHFYRFEELFLEKKYETEDPPHKPSGPPFNIDYGAVYPMAANLKASELSGELQKKAEAFNVLYSQLVREVQNGIDGKPEALNNAIGTMTQLGGPAEALLKTPIPGRTGVNAGPTFEFI